MKCNIVCVQTYPRLFHKKENVNRMEQLVREIMTVHPDTQLIVFPELAISGYECGEEFFKLAEIVDKHSFSIEKIAQSAREFSVHIIFGMPEKSKENANIIYNSQILIDDKGDIAGSYQKVHLFDGEKKYFTPGKEFRVFDTKIGKIGLFICYDAFFPEAARILAVKGVDLLVNSTNWEAPYDYDMEMAMSSRAFENTVYLVCSNRVGKDKKLSFFGKSRILDPLGRVIETVEADKEGYVFATIDYDIADKMKKDYYTMLTERRPELYGLLMN